MSVADDVYIRRLEKKFDDLERDYMMLQQTLALVLFEIGEPVTLLHQTVVQGLPEGTQIFIDEDPVTHDHTLGLTFQSVDNDA